MGCFTSICKYVNTFALAYSGGTERDRMDCFILRGNLGVVELGCFGPEIFYLLFNFSVIIGGGLDGKEGFISSS